jgi:outer membrane protein assembly factor BamB
MRRGKVCGGLLLALGFLVSPALHAENWPSWRGPDNNGISHETKVPVEWSATKNIAWKLPLPAKGCSTPVVWGERIFLTGCKGTELFLCCASTDGKLLWQQRLGTSLRPSIKYDEANEASSSPSTDGKNVYAYVGSGDLACFDFEGKEIWKLNVQEKYGKFKIMHGMHTTPLLYSDRLYLSLMHSNGHWLIAFDKASGKEMWKVERTTDAAGEATQAYTSPCLWNTGKDECLVVSGCDYATGHRLSDGSEIWRLGGLNPKTRYQYAFRIIASPVATPELLVVPTCRGSTVVGVKPRAMGDVTAGGFEQWRTRGAPDVPSPLIQGGQVYLCRENGVLICLDAATGKELYQKRIHSSRYRASPVYVDGKIYLTARDDGTFHVVKAGPSYELLATNVLPDEFAASPVISGGRIYLRGFRALYAIQDSGSR